MLCWMSFPSTRNLVLQHVVTKSQAGCFHRIFTVGSKPIFMEQLWETPLLISKVKLLWSNPTICSNAGSRHTVYHSYVTNRLLFLCTLKFWLKKKKKRKTVIRSVLPLSLRILTFIYGTIHWWNHFWVHFKG